MENKTQWLKWITEIQALAQSGLAYSTSDYDIERYKRLTDLIAELASHCSNQTLTSIKTIFSVEKGYATPKIDVRSFTLKNNKVLLVRERCDGLWTLPGGWVDVNESPAEAVIRETREETGFHVSTRRLLALWDKLKHDHPPQWPHAWKCFFLCEIESGKATENLEISEVDFFNMDALPPLSTHRVTARQLERLYALSLKEAPTEFD